MPQNGRSRKRNNLVPLTTINRRAPSSWPTSVILLFWSVLIDYLWTNFTSKSRKRVCFLLHALFFLIKSHRNFDLIHTNFGKAAHNTTSTLSICACLCVTVIFIFCCAFNFFFLACFWITKFYVDCVHIHFASSLLPIFNNTNDRWSYNNHKKYNSNNWFAWMVRHTLWFKVKWLS